MKENHNLSGRVASVGQGFVRGIARIINNEADLGRIQSGEIMIAAQTDIAYAPTMQICAGIVTELGGRFCHAAIFTREHQIPCITDVSEARTLIPDGALICLDTLKNSILVES